MTTGIGVSFMSWFVILVMGALLSSVVLLLLGLLIKNPRARTVVLVVVVTPVMFAVGMALLAIVFRSTVSSARSHAVVNEWAPVEISSAPEIRGPINLRATVRGVEVAESRDQYLNKAAKGEPSPKDSKPQKVRVESEQDGARESAGHRMTVILKPAGGKGTAERDIAVDIRTEEGKQSQMAGLLLALANALRKAVAESPQAETAADFVSKVIPTSTSAPVEALPSRPAWVEASPELLADGVYQMPIVIGPFETRLECDRKMPGELRRALDTYVDGCLGTEAVGRVGLPDDYLRTHLVRQTWEEKRNISVTSTERVPMVLLHVLVAFDGDVKSRLREAWHRLVMFERLRRVGLGLALLLMLLSTFWAYLRIDLSTGGAYRNRLRLATVLVIALIAVLMRTLA